MSKYDAGFKKPRAPSRSAAHVAADRERAYRDLLALALEVPSMRLAMLTSTNPTLRGLAERSIAREKEKEKEKSSEKSSVKSEG